MALYVPGDRLWVRLEGFDWWPARVLDAEGFREAGGVIDDAEGADLFVMFYPGVTTAASLSALSRHAAADHLCYFETSSEKAVTNDAELRAAIRHAEADGAANPLNPPAPPHPSRGAKPNEKDKLKDKDATNAKVRTEMGGASASVARLTKRGRAEEEEHAAGGGGLPPAAAAAAAYRHLPTESLMELAGSLEGALAANDVATVRRCLCELDNVDVPQSQLESSKIGVAVGNVLGNAACSPLWALARALISFWARYLPEETLEAIRRLKQEVTYAAKKNLMVTEPGSPGVGSPVSMRSPLFFGSPNSPREGFGAGLTATSPLLRAPTDVQYGAVSSSGITDQPAVSSPSPPRSSFYSTLCQLLDDPLSTTKVPVETMEKVVKELVRALQGQDERLLLLSRLRNPGLAFVRENLLSGRWTAAQYIEQPEEVFVTDKEKEEEEQRLRQKLKAFEEAKLANVNFTNMFTCRSCKGKRCHYYEQQTRGADEPTTKFITCLDCKNVWTEE